MPYSFDFVYLIVCLCKCNKKPLVFPLCHPLFCATLKSKAHTKCVSFVVYGGYMRVFDFDNTIYDGESVFDFFLFCVKKQKYLLKYMPLMIKDLIFYKMRLLTEEKLYEQASGLTKEIVKNREHANDYIEEFWRLNSRRKLSADVWEPASMKQMVPKRSMTMEVGMAFTRKVLLRPAVSRPIGNVSPSSPANASSVSSVSPGSQERAKISIRSLYSSYASSM